VIGALHRSSRTIDARHRRAVAGSAHRADDAIRSAFAAEAGSAQRGNSFRERGVSRLEPHSKKLCARDVELHSSAPASSTDESRSRPCAPNETGLVRRGRKSLDNEPRLLPRGLVRELDSARDIPAEPLERRGSIMNTQHRAPKPKAISAPDPGPVLVLAPHLDDELIGCGGTLCLHAAQGDPVHVIIAFDERTLDASDRAEESERLARAHDAARERGTELGFSSYEFWDYPTGRHPEPVELEFGARRLAQRIGEIEPRTVYAPWLGEHPIDHHVLARATRLALEMAEFTGSAWGYEVWTPLVPTRIVDITPAWEEKRAAIARCAAWRGQDDLVHRTLGLNAQRSLYLARHARFGEAFAPFQHAPEKVRARI
jgi:LmbE family N-acetylglucosaminyl deacetylase